MKKYDLSSRRDATIDIIKGWAMLTIIIFHTSSNCFSGMLPLLLGNSWNVPVFFIVAGFFMREDSLDKTLLFIKKKIIRLYIPASIIYAISILLHNIFVKIGWYPLGGIHPGNGVAFDLFGWNDTIYGLIKVLLGAGSGELIMGAMWFLYTLLYAFIGIAFIYWFISLFTKDRNKLFWLMTVVLLLLAVSSCILTQRFNISISRFSTALTSMFLIWWGMIINQKWEWLYDNFWIFLIAFIVILHYIYLQNGIIVLAKNRYQDLGFLLLGSSAYIYFWGFLGKKIQKTMIGYFLSLMGRESLYLMAFHILGFFLCNSFLFSLGIFNPNDPKGMYTYVIGDNFLLLLIYLIFSIGVSFVLLYIWRLLIGFFSLKIEQNQCKR